MLLMNRFLKGSRQTNNGLFYFFVDFGGMIIEAGLKTNHYEK
jgi:hypothetical protein